MSYRVKRFRKVDSGKSRSRARIGYLKPIRNGLRKKQNWIENRPSRAETCMAGREIGVRFQKEEYSSVQIN